MQYQLTIQNDANDSLVAQFEADNDEHALSKLSNMLDDLMSENEWFFNPEDGTELTYDIDNEEGEWVGSGILDLHRPLDWTSVEA